MVGVGVTRVKLASAVLVAGNVAAVVVSSPTAPVATTADPVICNTTPIATGLAFALAVVQSDGSLRAWGSNAYGELGDGTATDRATPVPVQSVTGVSSVAAGQFFALALESDGSIWAWGNNDRGQLGVTGTAPHSSPVRTLPGPNYVAVAAGFQHSLALDTSGHLWSWGSNLAGQLGNGTLTDSSTPTVIPGLSGITAISAGGDHSMALDKDGHVWAWGENAHGELGDGTTTIRLTPVQASIDAVAAISAGVDHSLALKFDGTVWAWGDNQNGELGNNNTTSTATPVQSENLNNAFLISAGAFHSLAVSNGGPQTTWAWGLNAHGQLGLGDTTSRSVPTAVSGLSDVTAIDAGTGFSLALDGSGGVSIWGQLFGAAPMNLRPTAVSGLPQIAQPVQPCGAGGGGGGGIISAPRLTLTIDPPTPTALSWAGMNYDLNPFPVVADVHNVGAAKALGVQVSIGLPAGLALSGNQNTHVSLGDLAPGAEALNTWEVTVPFLQVDKTYTYFVTASAANALSVVVARQIFVPKVPRRIVYVHGIGSSFLAIDKEQEPFTAGFIATLRARYGAKNVVIFPYYQDLGYRVTDPKTGQLKCGTVAQDGTFTPMPAPDTNTGTLHVEQNAKSADICDSASDLAYNAAMLDDFLRGYPGPTTIIANSEGGAITRGWLALRIDRPNSSAFKTVDSVVFIQVPHGGSWLALQGPNLVKQFPQALPAGMSFEQFVQQYFGITNLKRPGVIDVLPESDWYISVNPKGVPLQLHYYNFYDDIRVTLKVQVWFAQIPFQLFDAGDGVVRPVDDDPQVFRVWPNGNSRFLPGHFATRDKYQFASSSSYTFVITNPNQQGPQILNAVLKDPYSHVNFIPNYATDKVDSCIRGTGQVTEILKIEQILDDPAQGCNP